MAFLENIGRLAIKFIKSFTDIIYFAGKVLFRIFNRNTYNSAMRTVLLDQIYFTSVQILPIFLIVELIAKVKINLNLQSRVPEAQG